MFFDGYLSLSELKHEVRKGQEYFQECAKKYTESADFTNSETKEDRPEVHVLSRSKNSFFDSHLRNNNNANHAAPTPTQKTDDSDVDSGPVKPGL